MLEMTTGVYKCEIEDDNAQVIGAAYAAVTIGHSAKKPAEMKFDENAEAVLNCPVLSGAARDGDMPSKVQQNQSRLVIKDFDDDTAGLYVCKVNIDNHVVEGYVDAMISVPDTIIQVLLEPSSENVQVGDRLWSPKAPPVHRRAEDNSGTYKCVAKTRAATLEAKTVLNIGSKLGFQTEPLEMTRGIGQQLPVPDLNDNSGELSGEEVTVASLPPTPPPTTTTPRPPVVVHPDPYVTPCPGGRCRWPDLCANHRCGVNGVCRQLNESHFECECKIYYDGPNCDIFKPIEHAARFNGDAFIEMAGDDFPHLSSELEETIEFKFKTSRMNGVIFWQGQNPDQSLVGEDYVSIGIRDGFLVFAYELGGGAAEMVSIFRVDDGLMHNVLAIRKGRDGALFVDDFPPVNGSSSGILAMLNVDGNVYIGGVPDLKFMTGGLHRANFDGCVADVTLNGDKMDLMGSAVDGRNVRPCDEWVAPKRFLHRHRRNADWPPLTKTEADQIDAALDLRIRSRHRWGRKEKFFF
ncbi:unnamed protein product, partial [Mesorhabditis spiculigera]